MFSRVDPEVSVLPCPFKSSVANLMSGKRPGLIWGFLQYLVGCALAPALRHRDGFDSGTFSSELFRPKFRCSAPLSQQGAPGKAATSAFEHVSISNVHTSSSLSQLGTGSLIAGTPLQYGLYDLCLSVGGVNISLSLYSTRFWDTAS